jgi:hypothetical protein
LAQDTDIYPDWTLSDGSQSTVFPPEPPDRGWQTPQSIEEIQAEIDAGRGDDEVDGIDDHLSIIGVVVAAVTFPVRLDVPALFMGVDLSTDDHLNIMARSVEILDAEDLPPEVGK